MEWLSNEVCEGFANCDINTGENNKHLQNYVLDNNNVAFSSEMSENLDENRIMDFRSQSEVNMSSYSREPSDLTSASTKKNVNFSCWEAESNCWSSHYSCTDVKPCLEVDKKYGLPDSSTMEVPQVSFFVNGKGHIFCKVQSLNKQMDVVNIVVFYFVKSIVTVL